MMQKNEYEQRVQLFNEKLPQYLPDGTPETLYKAVQHLPFAGGKRLRPVLAMLACESLGCDKNNTIPFGAALEIMHNFTLVHDDIMDKSTLRRNLPTVHIEFGEQTAILAGDFLFAKSFSAMHQLNVNHDVFKQLDFDLINCILEICEGQQLDVEFEQRKIVSEEEYLQMIQKKTAVLFRLATRGGAIIANATPEQVQALTDYGLNLGLAFQIWDDYLDLSSDEETLGKDIGNDIRNGKKTLIAVHALEHATGENKQLLEKIFGNQNASESEVKQILQLFRELQSVDYAKQTAIHYNNTAKKALDLLEDSHAKQLLVEIADFAIQREK